VAARPPYIIEPLGAQHDRKAFSSGEPSLDTYLQRQAGQDVKRDLAACYVLCERDSTAILGYFTLSASSVELRDLPPELAKRAGRYPLVPAVLLGRLAVDQQAQGGGLGAVLLADALQRALQTGVGVKLVIVDALSDRAVRFYEHHGFRRFEDISVRFFIAPDTIRGMDSAG
jgi:GNAT superfamily N-acetyltransferase